MEINNSLYGGFVVSNNIINGVPVRYSFREESSIQQLNGSTLYSINDDNEYISDPRNFKILSMESVYKVAPVMIELFNAPYGTDLCWLYEKNILIGFYDLVSDKETTIKQILGVSGK